MLQVEVLAQIRIRTCSLSTRSSEPYFILACNERLSQATRSRLSLGRMSVPDRSSRTVRSNWAGLESASFGWLWSRRGPFVSSGRRTSVSKPVRPLPLPLSFSLSLSLCLTDASPSLLCLPVSEKQRLDYQALGR